MEPIFIEKLYKDITPEEKNKVGENYFICLHSSDASGIPYFEYLVVLNNKKASFIARFKGLELAEEYIIWKNSKQ